MRSLIILAVAGMSRIVSGQSTDAPQTTPSPSLFASSSSADATWTNPVIASLWSDAASLISTYYPSSTITNVGSLSWPTEVVIGSSTHFLAPSPLSTSVSPSSGGLPSQTTIANNTTSASTDNNEDKKSHTDKRLGIALGVGIGSVALGVLVFLVWLLHRRRKRTGSFTARRQSDPSDDEIQAWRITSSKSLVQFPEKYTTFGAPRPPMPLEMTHPGLIRAWENGDEIRATDYSNRHSNPFDAPYESYAELEAGRPQHTSFHELGDESSMRMLDDRRPPSLVTRAAITARRPSTPYTPGFMREATGPGSPVSPVDDSQHRGYWTTNVQNHGNPYSPERTASDRYESGHQSLSHQSTSTNPFLSEEDDELEAPPSIPSRNDRRRSSPAVHYPTGDELSTFNFGLSGTRRGWTEQRDINDEYEWREQPATRKESVDGRHELA